VYTATIARDDLIRDRLRDAAEKLCEGSFSPLLTQLVDAGSLSAEEVLTLRRLIERLDQEES
jgi:predicted transcriptional regulator